MGSSQPGVPQGKIEEKAKTFLGAATVGPSFQRRSAASAFDARNISHEKAPLVGRKVPSGPWPLFASEHLTSVFRAGRKCLFSKTSAEKFLRLAIKSLLIFFTLALIMIMSIISGSY